MQIVERDDDFASRVPFRRNGSMACVSPLLLIDSLSRKSFSYNKLPQEPLKLTVLKLDGSSFAIEVAKTSTVEELKQAVEVAFSHLPKKGPGKVSWPHVWGNFCLSYDGQKLLTNSDYLRSYGIQDGDQLHFIRHSSIKYNLIKARTKKEVPELEQPRMSLCRLDAIEEREQSGGDDDSCHDQENLKLQPVEDNVYVTHCEYKLAHVLRGWFSYRRLRSPEMSFEQKSCSSSPRLSNGFFGSFRNIVRLYSNKYNSRIETWKAE